MHPLSCLSRRRFLQASAATIAAAPLVSLAQEAESDGLTGRIYKTLKIGMVKVPGSLIEKFQAVKEAGFAGIEMNAPSMDVEETRRAIAETGLPVDGTVCSTHWSVRHTDPDPAVRAQALENLKSAIRDTHAVGGHTALLVVGHGKDGPEDVIWRRSIENIAQAIPLAAELGVVIAIENVWNHFLYDHEGGADQSAEKFAAFVDELNSPWVGMQFDIGNHWKYGDVGQWIRTLGRRIVKLDIKGFSRKTGEFTAIGEGDVDWAGVRQALRDINYYGWCAAEVSGGGREELTKIATQMNRVLGLR
ncbi:MAG: sugar phosphate isomerase/epimerase [Planctomycetes bacterium]|nr:sugar phosphate isomerase/epimerase [Planctomycetota bacterium]